jgi:hypothetical protein
MTTMTTGATGDGAMGYDDEDDDGGGMTGDEVDTTDVPGRRTKTWGRRRSRTRPGRGGGGGGSSAIVDASAEAGGLATLLVEPAIADPELRGARTRGRRRREGGGARGLREAVRRAYRSGRRDCDGGGASGGARAPPSRRNPNRRRRRRPAAAAGLPGGGGDYAVAVPRIACGDFGGRELRWLR